MVNLYKSNELLFKTNGIEILDDIIISAEVERTLNGSFFANVCVLKDKLGKYLSLTHERIITLNTPRGIQPFRIVDINPVNGSHLNLIVKHVMHDINKRVVKRCKVDSGNGAFALNKFRNSLDVIPPHTFSSNITTNASFDWVRKKGLNILIGDDENSFLKKYGGEIDVNFFNISINDRIGTDRGFIAQYRKNIKAFNALYTTDHLITRIIPVGYDGITLDDNGHIDSPKINYYNNIFCEVIHFKDIKYKYSPNNNEEEGFETLKEAQDALTKAVKEYFTTTKCDEIPFTADIDVAMLKDTAEYKNSSLFEEIQLGDDVLVNISEDNIKTTQRMTYYKYNAITQKYINITIGSTIDDYFKEINNSIKDTVTKDELENEIGDALGGVIDKTFEEVNNKIQNGSNLSHIKFLPDILNPSEIIACDNEDLEKAVYVVRINKAGLGVSTTGYNGVYQGLITEGKLALNEITCNQFTAALIKAGMLSDETGKTWINMDNGEFNFKDLLYLDSEGRLCSDNIHIFGGERLGNIDIRGTNNKGIVIRSLNGGDRYIDFSTFNGNDNDWNREVLQGNFTRLWAMHGDFYILPTDRLFISSCNSKVGNSKLDEVVIKAAKTTIEGDLVPDNLNAVRAVNTPSITVNNIYAGDGWLIINSQMNIKNKIYCEDYLLTKKIGHGSTGGVLNKNEPITFYSPIEMNNCNIGGVGTVSTTNLAANSSQLNYAKINYLNGDLNCNQKQIHNIKYMNGEHLSASKVSCNELSGGSYFKFLSSADFNRNSLDNVYRLSCMELAVSGSKNCVQETENYGKRLINAYETADYLFGDIGECVVENGECVVWIDDIFKEVISTDVNYQVFLTKYGKGDIWVSERHSDYFVVQAENDIRFAWEIKAKRKGFENYRLEEYVEENEYAQENNTI